MQRTFKKEEGIHVFFIGMIFSFIIFIIFLIAVRITQVNQLYDEVDEGLTSALLSSAIVNRSGQTKTKQIVIADLSDFEGGLTAGELCVTYSDEYMENCLEKFRLILEDNLYLDGDYVPKNPLVDTEIEITKFAIYNKYNALTGKGETNADNEISEEDGQYLSGDFRFCKHSYNTETENWNTPVLYDINEKVYVADSLTGNNIELQGTTVVAQIELKVNVMPFLRKLYPEGYDNSRLTKTVYYQRMADIVGSEYQYDGICDHSYTELERTEASCMTQGYIVYKCNKCGVTYRQILSPHGHDFIDNICVHCGIDMSKCTHIDNDESGYCDSCGAYLGNACILYGHKWETEDKYTHKCSVCLIEHSHSFNETVYTTPSCDVKGNVTYTCSECGYSYEMRQTAHEFEEIEGTDTHKCKKCGLIESHSYSVSVIKDPTCTETGLLKKSCSCGRYTEETIAKTAHVGNIWEITKKPTCTEKGEKKLICSYCNEQVSTAVIPALGHLKSEDGTVTKEPTCTEDGTAAYKCRRCGEAMESVLIPATGHMEGTEYFYETDNGIKKGKRYKKCASCDKIYLTQYLLTVSAGEGVSSGAEQNEYVTAGTTVSLSATVEEGYEWNGWFDKNTKLSGLTAYSFTMPEKAYALTATAGIRNSWQIRYDKNTALIGEMENSSFTGGNGNMTLSLNEYLKPGYVFLGWNAKADGKEAEYTNGQVLQKKLTDKEETVNLYAVWQKRIYSIGYDMEDIDITGLMDSYDVTKKAVIKIPEKEGYDLKSFTEKIYPAEWSVLPAYGGRKNSEALSLRAGSTYYFSDADTVCVWYIYDTQGELIKTFTGADYTPDKDCYAVLTVAADIMTDDIYIYTDI